MHSKVKIAYLAAYMLSEAFDESIRVYVRAGTHSEAATDRNCSVRYKSSSAILAKSWTTPRRIVAKVEVPPGAELFGQPRTGSSLRPDNQPARVARVVRFYNRAWIRRSNGSWKKASKQATHLDAVLSCHRFRRRNEYVRLQLRDGFDHGGWYNKVVLEPSG